MYGCWKLVFGFVFRVALVVQVLRLQIAQFARLIQQVFHSAYEECVIAEKNGQLHFTYGDFDAGLQLQDDGRISAFSGELDGLDPSAIYLYPQDNGDIRILTPDSGDLRLLFTREG